MKRFVILVTLVLLPLACVSAQEPEVADKDVKAAAASSNGFGFDLYAKLAAEKGGENLFVSPASITTALSMVYSGARGETAAEMKKVLNFTLADAAHHPAMGRLEEALEAESEGHKTTLANALWGQKGYPFLKGFLALNEKCYGAGLKELDIHGATEEARQTINKWVEKNTNNKIRDLIKKGILDPETKLVLTNAIHFKGTWKRKFEKKHTKKEFFHPEAGGKAKIDFMHVKDHAFRYFTGEGFQALEMPYDGEETSMLFLLPDEGTKIAALEAQVTAENLDKWINGIKKRKYDDVAIPRFKMTCDYNAMEKTLKAMGMVVALDANRADFSGMTGGRDLFLDKVVHKAFVDVNEEGTEAAAATGGMMAPTSVRKPVVFRADRPFLFLIRDHKTGMVLFLGRFMKP
ncbi:MAG: serpin family protein [Planctomycetota bacterium]|jgi:serpin B